MSVPGFSVVKNVDGLTSKKTFLDVLLWGEKPQRKHHPTKQNPETTSEGCLIILFVFSFSALPVKVGEDFEWVIEGLG